MRPANVHIEWARLLLGTLAQAGVHRLVLSPGSRNTPLIAAALRVPGLDIVDVLDERSAGFVALGHARASGQPAVLVCTSGSAGAHYLPAVIEAHHARLPLLVLTADRPPELQGREASQTIEQHGLYGAYAPPTLELGLPDEATTALRGLRYAALRAVVSATGPTPGAVHLNAPFRKPLEPQPPNEADASLTATVDALLARPLPRAYAGKRTPDPQAIAAVAALCSGAERGLIVAGPASMDQRGARQAVARLVALTGYPLLAEATSQLGEDAATACRGFDALLASGAGDALGAPELVLQLGSPPMSAAFGPYLAPHRGSFAHVVIAPDGFRDPANDASHFVFADVEAAVAALGDALASSATPRPAESRWDRAWRDASRRLEARLAEVSPEAFPYGVAMRDVVRALPAGALLAVGNSLSVRVLDAFTADLRLAGPVLSQRGASGIDGNISGAVGAALASGKPVALVTGDVAFLHDLQGLEVARRLETPLVVVVVNNDGGRIFDGLPVAKVPELAPEVERHWVMRHGLTMASAAALFGHVYASPRPGDELRQALAEAWHRPGCTVLEVAVPGSAREPELQRLAASFGV